MIQRNQQISTSDQIENAKMFCTRKAEIINWFFRKKCKFFAALDVCV